MPTAQEIYDSLIKNPNYQATSGLSREEVVKREALRRARQHANNEKALSMALQNSALGKLSSFVQNAFIEDVTIQKAFTEYDRNVLTNIQQHANMINNLGPYIQTHEGGQDEDGEDVNGWQQFRDSLGQQVRYHMYDTPRGAKVNVFNFAPQAKKWHDILKQLLAFSDSFTNEDGVIAVDPPMGIADLYEADPDAAQIADNLFNDNNGTLKSQAVERINLFMEKANELHEGILEDGMVLRTDTGGGPTPTGGGGGTDEREETGGGGEGGNEVTGNANHQSYVELTPEEKAQFHDFMVPEARMDELSPVDFDNAIVHFLDGITQYPGDLAAQEQHWSEWTNPLNPGGGGDREDEEETGGPRNDEGGGEATGGTWTGSPDRLSYGADLNVDDYKPYLPRKLNGENAPILKPKDLEGNEFDPLEGVEDDASLQQKLASLKELYHQFHEENDGTTATLGRGTYFPQEPAEEGQQGVLKFKKDEFEDDKIKKYNELNTSKAIMEEYLKVMNGMTQGYIGSPWHVGQHIPESDDYEAGFIQGVWGDRADIGSESNRFTPQDGAWEWHVLLETLSNTDWEEGGAVRAGDSARDDEGNLNWHMIPNEYMTSWTYHNALQNLENFMGTASDASGIPKARYGEDNPDGSRNLLPLTERSWKEFGARFIENNPLRFPGLADNVRTASGAAGSKFNSSWNAYKNANGNINDVDAFIEWMETPNSDGTPNWQVHFNGKPKTPRTGGGGRSPTPRLDGEADTSVDPEKRQAMINRLMDAERRHGFSGSDEQVHREYLERLSDSDLEKEHTKHVVEANRASRREASKNAANDEGHLTHARRQEMIRDYINSHKEMYHQSLDPRLVKVLEEKSDKELQSMHEKMMNDHGEHSRKSAESLREYRGNNIDFAIKSMAPLQEHLTKEDILMQARRLIHHKQAYGDVMDGDAKKVWKERMQEAHQLADAANMNLDMRLQEDMENADEHGDFGSTAWLERVGEAHHGTLTRRNAHQAAVSGGGELRTNRNYKPHIIATYGDDGEFQGFHDLMSDQPVDQHMLQFDEDNHYHFHGLDDAKVKEYQKYLKMKGEEKPSEIPPVFGPPPSPTHNELKELEDKIHGDDFKDVRDRFEEIGDLPGAEDSFYRKFKMRPTGRPGRPINSDGSESEIPRFRKDANDGVGMQGWYHPESGSWINPYRWRELIDHMEGQTNAGRVVLHGQQFYGKGNTADPNYAFALPTETTQKRLRSGYGDQAYYVGGDGAIAHASDSYDSLHTQDHVQPQSVNGVIHDWVSQQIGNQMKASPDVFRNQEGKVRQVAVINPSPEESAMVDPPSTVEASPFQNMWLEKVEGEALGREPGSALARREQKKQSGWEWFNRHGGSEMKEGIDRLQHPRSEVARDPLSPQELGQNQWWSNLQEAKQKYFDVIDYPRSGLLSWVGKLLVGGERPEDKVIRRVRQGYKIQADTERLTREAADSITVNGKRLSESYVAPGEQKARTEDYDELKRYFAHQKNVHNNLKNVARESKDKDLEAHHNSQYNKYTGHAETLGQLDSKMPHHWDKINALYNDHLGKVNQAPTAADSLKDMGSKLAQPTTVAKVGQWGKEMNQPPEKDPVTIQEPQINHPNIPKIFGGKNQSEIPSVFV